MPVTQQVVQPSLAKEYGQARSPFFRLSTEVRLLIYEYHFLSTRLTWSLRFDCPSKSYRRRRSHPHALAILHVCRRMKDDIGHTWISQVLFNFDNNVLMMDNLAALPPNLLGKVRHVRVRDEGVGFLFERDEGCEWGEFYLPSFLKLLPKLRLDTLTVLGNPNVALSYSILDKLINETSGWKMLRYISATPEILAFEQYHVIRWDGVEMKTRRQPQPSQWQHVLESRDGNHTGASVHVYLSTEAHAGTVTNPLTRRTLEQTCPEDSDARKSFGLAQDTKLMSLVTNWEENCKELLVVVKRGKGANYEQEAGLPMTDGDLREHFPKMDWKVIRASASFIVNWHDNMFSRRKYPGDFFDEYHDVEEHDWYPDRHIKTCALCSRLPDHDSVPSTWLYGTRP